MKVCRPVANIHHGMNSERDRPVAAARTTSQPAAQWGEVERAVTMTTWTDRRWPALRSRAGLSFGLNSPPSGTVHRRPPQLPFAVQVACLTAAAAPAYGPQPRQPYPRVAAAIAAGGRQRPMPGTMWR